jgi:hypothetical protein
MKPLRLYIDNSVFGGCFDKGIIEDSVLEKECFQKWSGFLF